MSKRIIKVIPKITQIAGDSRKLFALDEYGNVWMKDYYYARTWVRAEDLPETTAPLKPMKENK